MPSLLFFYRVHRMTLNVNCSHRRHHASHTLPSKCRHPCGLMMHAILRLYHQLRTNMATTSSSIFNDAGTEISLIPCRAFRARQSRGYNIHGRFDARTAITTTISLSLSSNNNSKTVKSRTIPFYFVKWYETPGNSWMSVDACNRDTKSRKQYHHDTTMSLSQCRECITSQCRIESIRGSL